MILIRCDPHGQVWRLQKQMGRFFGNTLSQSSRKRTIPSETSTHPAPRNRYKGIVMARFVWRMILIVGCIGSGLAWESSSAADKVPKKQQKLPAPPAPPSAWLAPEPWQKTSLTSVQPEEIDQLIFAELKARNLPPAPLTTDEQFVRRLYLDLTGRLPSPAQIAEFIADKDAAKRAKLIDRLLASDAYARHWARYWRDTVIGEQQPGEFRYQLEGEFEEWLFEQFKKNQPWDATVTALLTAEGMIKRGEQGKNGAIFFLGRVSGEDGQIVRTNETARLFLGIQIQCAQCHDANRGGKPSQWKQVQFHELTGFFARLAGGGPGRAVTQVKLNSLKNKAEREMPDKDDPDKHYVTLPRFLDGQAPAQNIGDLERRSALAQYVTSKKNFWFAAAYVNRVWGEYLGQSFYDKVDDLGPNRNDYGVMRPILARLTGAFRAADYDTRALARLVLNTQAYQRQSQLGQTADQHLAFAAVYPTRLRADVVRQSLEGILGQWTVAPWDRIAKNLEAEFYFDPSAKPDEVQGGILQALWLMNNQMVNNPMRYKAPPAPAKADAKAGSNETLLQQVLTAHTQDDDAVRALYLRVLARKATDREMQTCREHLQETLQAKGKRTDAFEDILWALINSTEFLRKR